MLLQITFWLTSTVLWLRRRQDSSEEAHCQESNKAEGEHSAWNRADLVGRQIQGKAMCFPEAAKVWFASGDRSFQGQWSPFEACQPGADYSLSFSCQQQHYTAISIHPWQQSWSLSCARISWRSNSQKISRLC